MNNDTINMIAKDILDINTLETQNSGKDFHELAVWQIKQALEEAYTAGKESLKGTVIIRKQLLVLNAVLSG